MGASYSGSSNNITELKNLFDNFKTPDIPNVSAPNTGSNQGSTNYGQNISRGSIYDRPNYGNIFSNPGVANSNSAPVTVVVNYNPAVTLGDKKEAERVLVPMVREALRGAQ